MKQTLSVRNKFLLGNSWNFIFIEVCKRCEIIYFIPVADLKGATETPIFHPIGPLLDIYNPPLGADWGEGAERSRTPPSNADDASLKLVCSWYK